MAGRASGVSEMPKGRNVLSGSLDAGLLPLRIHLDKLNIQRGGGGGEKHRLAPFKVPVGDAGCLNSVSFFPQRLKAMGSLPKMGAFGAGWGCFERDSVLEGSGVVGAFFFCSPFSP